MGIKMEFDQIAGPKMPLTPLANITAHMRTPAIEPAPVEIEFSMEEAAVPEPPTPDEQGELVIELPVQDARKPIIGIETVVFSGHNGDQSEIISPPNNQTTKPNSPSGEILTAPVSELTPQMMNQRDKLESNLMGAATLRLKVDIQSQSVPPANQLSSTLQEVSPTLERRLPEGGFTPKAAPAIADTLAADAKSRGEPQGTPPTLLRTTPAQVATESASEPLTQNQSLDTKSVPSIVAQPQAAQPNVPQALNPFEHIPNDPSDMFISLRVERPIAEAAPSTLAATKAATPITSQISTQIPQLLSKLDTQTLELRLDPPELGRVTIHLNTHEHQITAHISADRADTVELMRRHAELLSTTLAKAGFSQANLSFQQGDRQENGHDFGQVQDTTPHNDIEDLAPTATKLIGLNGRLDIRL